MQIRNACDTDAKSLMEIYNDAVENTTAIWNEHRVDILNRIQWINEKKEAGFPVYVATDEADRVIGYASYGYWRAWDGYRYTVEHSVYVHKAMRGKGIGRLLMERLIKTAQEQGMHVMVAAIESGNLASILLHEKLGFTHNGKMTEVGCKFGRWLDLTFLQLKLDSRSEP